eukprot:TRINITY_DN8635_c0_g1_i1.p1 TRINITY_DN8635_c0_g1~~TRINITY_DN8635_c0_g1_i1.p1  ORF type:complete len:274 (-),score=35.17 TRINITY_DN8635_c0_g1_i1:123-944(-)
MSTSVLAFTPSINDLHLNTINGVLGDVSQSHLNEYSSPQQRVQAHLQYVLNILESGQFAPASLTASQKQKRSECINILRAYMNAGIFPHQFEYPDPSATHRPCFKDDANNVCAVGHLIEKTAGMEVVDQINNSFKFSYIRDMDLSLVASWQTEHGFSLIELAMIQPSYSFMRPHFPISSPPISPVVHTNVRCDICGTAPIYGVRYKCASCPNFDLCANCESIEANHDKTHVFLKLRYPITAEPSNSQALLPGIRVQPTPGPSFPTIPHPHVLD